MFQNDMTYETLLEDALNTLPAFKKEYVKNIDGNIIDKDAGMHVVFGYVFVPVLEKALDEKDKPTIHELFDYLEKMSLCEDSDVVAVCDQSVLEIICGEYKDKTLLPYMGKGTTEGLNTVRQYIMEP